MKKLWKLLTSREFLLYVLFGVLTTLVNFGAFWVLEPLAKTILGERSYWLSNPIAWFLSVVFAFVTNKWFVFEHKSKKPKTIAKEAGGFFASRLATLGIEQGLMIVFFSWLEGRAVFWVLQKLQPLPAWATFERVDSLYRMVIKVCVISVITVILNYVFSKLFVFRKKGGAKAEANPAQK
ncbi:MAG: GtrA family protein [Oscillospiraceae bacterium]|jgi:putative flippase GtrA|nr:GtrA family protein [Oscillospiraceae bacterium]